MNPEFQRNLWLEAGPRRLAWTGVVLAAIFGAALLVGGNYPLRAVGTAGIGVFLVCGLLWGPRIAGRAVAEEVMQRTWDFQRLSALTPWQMTWGKLFGAASLSWVAALVGLVLAVVAASLTGGADKVVTATLSGLGAAVLLQAGSMALALVGVRRARAAGEPAPRGPAAPAAGIPSLSGASVFRPLILIGLLPGSRMCSARDVQPAHATLRTRHDKRLGWTIESNV